MSSDMIGYKQAQEWYDGMLPPEHDTSIADKLSAYADKIELDMRKDAEDYGDMVIDAIAAYLMQDGSIPDDIMLGFKQIVGTLANAPFEMRHDPMVRFIDAAIRWKAEQLAKAEVKNGN